MQKLIDCDNKTDEELLIRILARTEPYSIIRNDYFELLIKTPLSNLKRVYKKYGYLGAGHTIRKSMSDRLSIKIMELEKLEPEKTITDIIKEKVEIAKKNSIEIFIFRFKGKVYFYDVSILKFVEITEL